MLDGYTKLFQHEVLASAMHSERVLDFALGLLTVEDFDTPAGQIIWEAIQWFHELHGKTPSPRDLREKPSGQ